MAAGLGAGMNRRIAACLAVACLAAALFAAPQKDKQKKEKAPPRPPATPWIARSEPVITRSDLKYWDIVVGEGLEAVRGKRVKVHYSGYLITGQKFDSSVDRGDPMEFRLGVDDVIRGWHEGIAGMRVGGRRKLRIPPHLAYGRDGAGGVIPPNATLTFDIELLAVR